MSNKLKRLTPEEIQERQNEEYLKGKPTRAEVANYCNALLEEKYMPEIMNHISRTQQAMQLGFMTLQAILIKKGICTGEEIEEITQEFIKQQQAESEKSKETSEEVKSDLDVK